MFQPILSEMWISADIRLLVARLQLPVLRVALEDTSFLATVTHPAKLLVDHIGICLFEVEYLGINNSSLKKEIEHIVQTVEQFPEANKRRLFHVLYAEFRSFLGSSIADRHGKQKLTSIAQRMDEKRTLTIQHTIKLRKTLIGPSMHHDIREFLVSSWAEVLAVATMRNGAEHRDTRDLMATADLLVWAADFKPNREVRARVIEVLPGLLGKLRAGLELLTSTPHELEIKINKLRDALSEVFLCSS